MKVVKVMAEEKKKKNEKNSEEINTEELEKLRKEVEDWKNKYYLAYADTENLKKDIEKEHRTFIKYRAMGFVEKLLPILDGFHLALQKEPDDPVLKNYLTGFKYVYKMLVDALDSEGVKELKPEVGDKFDEKTMEAVDVVEAEEPGKVAQIYQNGYQLQDRIIRHARVVVTKKPEESPKEDKDTSSESKTDSKEINKSDENVAKN